MCCGDSENNLDEGRDSTGSGNNLNRIHKEFTDEDEFVAAGIYRGEGSTYCHLGRRVTRFGRHPELVAGVTMCDRDSVEIVARVFGSKIYKANVGTCWGGQDAWQTRILGVSR